ncbi:MAG: L-threonylcarbamoyladenylate synthase [Blastocatellia bacterium]|nr:L-threonylcarbamoyladenylate synthase [Blastocatellia bacterium]
MIISQTAESFFGIAEVIARGGAIAFRTDTFYGLGADPFNHAAVQKLKQLKGSQNPVLIIVSDLEAVAQFIVEPTPAFDLLSKTFWPGPLTLIGKAASDVPEEITAGTQTVGVRLPDDDKVRALVRTCGGALTATSANPSHQQPATTAQEVFNYFGTAIDLIVDGGNVTAEQPSTVLDVSGAAPRLVREGAIAWSEIQAALERFK